MRDEAEYIADQQVVKLKLNLDYTSDEPSADAKGSLSRQPLRQPVFRVFGASAPSLTIVRLTPWAVFFGRFAAEAEAALRLGPLFSSRSLAVARAGK